MKMKKLMTAVVGTGVAAAMVALPVGAADAATSGTASCPTGRVVAIDAAGSGTIKVYVNGTLYASKYNGGAAVWGYQVRTALRSATYKVVASAHGTASWTCLLA
jgi:hypothetical protein